MTRLDLWFRALLEPTPASFEGLADFRRALDGARRFDAPIEAAALGGAIADRLGFAFVAGYHAAMAALLSSTGVLDGGRRACLGATERGGAHPRAIETTLTPRDDGSFLLDGEKSFVTLASAAEVVVVLARLAERAPAPRPKLVAVAVPLDRAGITATPRAETPFAPEIPHAKVRLDHVRVEATEVLPGDGYDDYLKPFRTTEDLHVLAALAGHLLRVSRRGSAHASLAPPLFGVLAETRALAAEPPRDAAVHVCLGPLFERARSLLGACVAALPPEASDISDRLARDAALLSVAQTVRDARARAAWTSLTERR